MPERPEFLEVEPLQLMHTGGFYLDLAGHNTISPDDTLSFGVSTRRHPEANASLYEYVYGQAPAHKRTKYESTAVYKPGYLERLGFDPADVLAGRVANIRWVPPPDGQGRLDVRAFGEYGVESSAQHVFNWKEIQALILSFRVSATGRFYAPKLAEKGLDIPLYIEEPNPSFEAEFGSRFAVVNFPARVDDHGISHTMKGMEAVRGAIEALIADPGSSRFDDYRSRGGNVRELCAQVRKQLAELEGTGKIIISGQFVRVMQERLQEQLIDADIPQRRYRLYVPGEGDAA